MKAQFTKSDRGLLAVPPGFSAQLLGDHAGSDCGSFILLLADPPECGCSSGGDETIAIFQRLNQSRNGGVGPRTNPPENQSGIAASRSIPFLQDFDKDRDGDYRISPELG